jgi:hypothetical protein
LLVIGTIGVLAATGTAGNNGALSVVGATAAIGRAGKLGATDSRGAMGATVGMGTRSATLAGATLGATGKSKLDKRALPAKVPRLPVLNEGKLLLPMFRLAMVSFFHQLRMKVHSPPHQNFNHFLNQGQHLAPN